MTQGGERMGRTGAVGLNILGIAVGVWTKGLSAGLIKLSAFLQATSYIILPLPYCLGKKTKPQTKFCYHYNQPNFSVLAAAMERQLAQQLFKDHP